MGIGPEMVKLLMREGKREEYAGSVITIGRQEVRVKPTQDLQKLAKEMKFQLNTNINISHPNRISENNNYNKNYITDTVLFLSLGFDNIDSLDISDYEQCTIIHDLNIDVPDKLHNKYDLIFDGGSSEHIFNLPKVLENYNKMLKTGGGLIHALPSSNNLDHGFYMFSPTLFWDYYSANNWEIKDSLLFRRSIIPYKGWDIYSYMPGCLDNLALGAFDKGIYGVFFVVKKTDKSIYNASVQQGIFLRTWKGASKKKKIYSVIPKSLKPISLFLYLYLHSLYIYISSKIPLRFHLKALGRY